MNLNRVSTRLESQHIRVQPNWLKEKSLAIQNQRRQLNEQQLIDLLREEYLNSDFRGGQVTVPVFPPDIEGVHQTTLFQQPAILQVLDVIDVGVSAQHLLDATIRNNDPNRGRILAEEEKSEGKFPRSMLKFTLTDGNQVTFAMEYRSLNNVDLFLPLGSKVLVNNVKVLRGVLLLEAQKFSVLGGQVEVLNQQSLIQRLRKRLNLEEENEESTNNLQSNNNNQNQPRTQGINEFASPQSVNFSGTTAYRSANSTATNLINSTSHSTIQNNGLPSRSQAFMPTSTSDNFDFDSDIEYQDQMLDSLLEQESFLFDSIPPDFVEEPSPPPSIEQHIREAPFPSFNPQSSHSRAKIPTIAVDDNEDSDEFDSMEFFQLHGDIDDTPIVLDSPKFTPVSAVTKSQQSHIDLTQKPRLKNEHLETNYGAATPDVIDLCDDDSFLLDESVQDMLAVAERLTSLRELENVKRSGVNSTYVKATINKFGKFSFDGQLFSVILTIKDTDNDDTEVILSNELVQKFLSHTPEEFKALTVPERRAEFQKILIDFKAKLTNLTAIMKLQFNQNDKPMVTEVRDVF